jgi:hypothetical protein
MTRALIATGLLVAGTLQNPQTPPAQEGTGTIAGVVTRGDTRQPLENVSIRLVRWEGGLGQQSPPTRTDSSGGCHGWDRNLQPGVGTIPGSGSDRAGYGSHHAPRHASDAGEPG